MERETVVSRPSPKIKASQTQGREPRPVVRAAIVVALWSLCSTASACEQRPAVIIDTPDGAVSVPVEIADTPAERARGLMYRRDLPANAGMLFVFPKAEVLQFWMKNTPLSLDMIFFDSERRIVGIVERAKPFSTRALGPDTPAQYVLEVHGGFAARHGITTGQQARFVNVPAAVE
ncbi:MAG: DUF192 domain-containing protein [Candidatus Binatia bacterium]|nr:DUF192 domain-containing protein [Candidatus Binatia bacterium]